MLITLIRLPLIFIKGYYAKQFVKFYFIIFFVKTNHHQQFMKSLFVIIHSIKYVTIKQGFPTRVTRTLGEGCQMLQGDTICHF